jgi:hypothetical protein
MKPSHSVVHPLAHPLSAGQCRPRARQRAQQPAHRGGPGMPVRLAAKTSARGSAVHGAPRHLRRTTRRRQALSGRQRSPEARRGGIQRWDLGAQTTLRPLTVGLNSPNIWTAPDQCAPNRRACSRVAESSATDTKHTDTSGLFSNFAAVFLQSCAMPGPHHLWSFGSQDSTSHAFGRGSHPLM